MASTSHCVDALGIQCMSCAKIRLRKVFTLCICFDRLIVATKFFILLTNAEVCHDFDSNEVVELVVEAFNLRIRTGKAL